MAVGDVREEDWVGRARARARVWGVLLGVGAAGILLVEGDQERDGLPGQLQACGQSGRQSDGPSGGRAAHRMIHR